LVKNKKETL